ncbi:MAG: hypothetical protein WCY75_12030 [Sulfurimonadaceae bacterium]
MLKIIMIIVIATIFIGCRTRIPYVPPVEGPMSTLALPADFTKYSFGFSGAFTYFAIADESGCGEFYGNKQVPKEQKTAEYIIPANKSVFIHYWAYIGNSSCRVTRVIKDIKEKKTYEVKGIVKWDRRDMRHYCSIDVIEQTENERIFIDTDEAYIQDDSKVCKNNNRK